MLLLNLVASVALVVDGVTAGVALAVVLGTAGGDF